MNKEEVKLYKRLRIRDNVDMRELEKYEFIREEVEDKRFERMNDKGEYGYYREIKYIYRNKINEIEIVERREFCDYTAIIEDREINLYNVDYSHIISSDIICKIYELIEGGLVEMEVQNEQ